MKKKLKFITTKTWDKWQRMCYSKVKHTTEQAAENHRLSLEQLIGIEFNKYPCQFCGYWHVGHMRKEEV